jgi:hypothetical protein
MTGKITILSTIQLYHTQGHVRYRQLPVASDVGQIVVWFVEKTLDSNNARSLAGSSHVEIKNSEASTVCKSNPIHKHGLHHLVVFQMKYR